jgi:hypothetical protein
MCKPGLGTHGVILHYNLEIEMASHRDQAKHALRDDRKKIAKRSDARDDPRDARAGGGPNKQSNSSMNWPVLQNPTGAKRR